MPSDRDPAAGKLTLTLDARLYPADAVRAAAHALARRATAAVEGRGSRMTVTLEPRGPATPEEARALAGDFLNEALAQLLRLRLLAENRMLNEYILTKALVSARRDPADPLQPKAAEASEMTDEQRREAARLEAEARGETA